MKKFIRFMSVFLAFLLLTVPVSAMESPFGCEYSMGPRAYVRYKGEYHYMQGTYLERSMQEKICSDFGWENDYTISFMNGKIYNDHHPDGVEGSEDFLTKDEFIYEYGRYVGFCCRLPAVLDSSLDFIALRDFGMWSLSEDYQGVVLDLHGKRSHNQTLGAPWYVYYAAPAIQAGFFSGSKGEDGYYFYPENSITREELTFILAQCGVQIDPPAQPKEPATREFAVQMLAMLSKKPEKIQPLPFSDVSEISAECITDVQNLYSMGIIGGYPDGTFRPKANLTRAEFAIMISHLLETDQLTVDTPVDRIAKEFVQQFTAQYQGQNPETPWRILADELNDFGDQFIHAYGLPEELYLPGIYRPLP